MKQYVHVFPCLDNRVVKFDITLHKKVDKFMLALIAYILWLHFRNVGYFNIYWLAPFIYIKLTLY